MGVSLQTYRIRIGTFQNSSCKRAKKTGPSETKVQSEMKTLLLVLLLSCILPWAFQIKGANIGFEYTPTTHPSGVFQSSSDKSTTVYQAQDSMPYQSNNSVLSSPQHKLALSSLPQPWPPPVLFGVVSRPPSLCSPSSQSHPQYSSTDPPQPWLAALPPSVSAKIRNKEARMIHGNRGQRGHGIKILHWNKGPSFLQNKHQDIETIIAGHTPHVLGLSEANFKTDHDASLVQHRDYNFHTCSTLQNQGLGISRVAVYTHNSLIVKRRPDLENDTISSIWLECGLPRQKKILICHAYREWQYVGQQGTNSGSVQAQLERWCIFLDAWERALQEGKEVIVMMDANLDFLKWTRDDLPPNDMTVRLKSLIDQLFSRILPHGVSQLVSVPTRAWPGQPQAGLDHLYSNKPDKLSSVYTEFTGGSDHKLIKVTRFSKSLKRTARYVRKRCYKEFSEAAFCSAVKQISWWDLYACDDASQAACILTSKLTNILDTMAPVRRIQIRTKYAPWLSAESKSWIKERDAAQSKSALSGDIDDWRKYKNIRNTTTARLRAEKSSWEKLKLDNTKHDCSSLWNNVKNWLNWSNSGPPSQLFHDGMLINSPARLAGTMNMFFLDKVRELQERIPNVDYDPLAKLRQTMASRQCTLSLKAVSPDDVLKIIMKLKNSKSTGVDDIDTFIIKLVANDIVPAVTHIVNLSIQQAVFPEIWKQSKVVPLLKKGDHLCAKNYRPVALLPILSKILERAIFNQLVEYLDANNLLHPNHHGSRQGHNTASALIQMYDNWVEASADGDMVGVMMVDLSAAFDMVDHSLLIEKLKLFGLDGKTVEWIQSYLLDRSQSVIIDGCLSPPLRINCGVPQGSILGPLMYVMFTNDIPDLVHDHAISFQNPQYHCKPCGGTVCYVDDSTYSVASPDPAVLTTTLTMQYKRISTYMAANKLVINDDKTHLVVMGSKAVAARRKEVHVVAGQHLIKPSSTEKLLGCQISEDLKWKEHILLGEQSLVKQLTSRVNGLCLISDKATKQTRLMVANGIVMSKLSYLIQLWGGCDSYLQHALQLLQNRAARVVTGQGRFTPIRKLLKDCNWLSVKQLIFFQTTALVHKVILTGSPQYLKERLSTSHPYRTRQSSTGSIRFAETFGCTKDTAHDSFCYRGTKEYNTIPASIRASRTLATFKTKLRDWVKGNVSID